jgi:myo-inositol-1(or 4)-monophosphatase
MPVEEPVTTTLFIVKFPIPRYREDHYTVRCARGATMMAATLDEFAAFAHELADASGDVIRPYFRTRIEVTDKGSQQRSFDPVTAADQEAEAVIRKLIKSRFPAHGIMGEEHGAEKGQDAYTWVLDPIDGTRAFICGVTQWGTLIALNDGERPMLGVLDQPYTRERWIGYAGKTEFVTREECGIVRTRPCATITQAVISTTHPTGYFTPPEQKAFQSLVSHARLSRYGGDCYAYGLLAMGFIDLIVEATLKAWDIQALIPIIEGAGGIVTTWEGGDAQNGGRIIAAGDTRLHAEALAVLSQVP